jgi:hypothetical protein
MLKNKLFLSMGAGAMAIAGMIGGTALMASAQTSSTSPAVTSSSSVSQTVDTPEVGDVADTPGTTEKADGPRGHRPLGGDGVVASITGSTIVMAEESDEGNASYTVDASKATVTNNGAAATLADVKVGAKIFVTGVTTGTNVAATSISLGHGGHGMGRGADTDGNGAAEASEPAGAPETNDQ